jgi:fatty acid desaturase
VSRWRRCPACGDEVPAEALDTHERLHEIEARLAARRRARSAPGALLLALALAIAPVLAHASEPPGRAVELQEGSAAPYTGALVDRERMGAILSKRIAAELERDALRLEVQDARARQAAAEQERSGRPSWGVVLGVGGAALVLGLVAGVVGVLAAQDRAAR